MLLSAVDGTLFLPTDVDGFMYLGFFQDFFFLPLLVLSAVTLFLLKRAMDMVPTIFDYVSEDTDHPDQEQRQEKIDKHFGETALVMFQAGERRTKWIFALDVVLTMLAAILVAFYLLNEATTPASQNAWNGANHFWGNMGTVVFQSLLFVYAIRVIFGYAIRLIWSISHLGTKLSADKLLPIEPLHPDGAGGLGPFGKLAWRIDLILLPAVIALVFFYVLSGLVPIFPLTAGFVGSTIVGIVFIPLFFFGPLWGLHRAMKKAKSDELQQLSRQFSKNSRTMWKWLNEKGISRNEGLEAQERLQRVILLYERSEKMPVWPFDHATLRRVVIYLLIPIGAALTNNLV